MSVRRAKAAASHDPAEIFAALGDPTRLRLVRRLNDGRRASIAELTEGTSVTRQAITKHLRVLERAGVVHGVRRGRESLFELRPEPLDEVQRYLAKVSADWDAALLRLKAFVEFEKPE